MPSCGNGDEGPGNKELGDPDAQQRIRHRQSVGCQPGPGRRVRAQRVDQHQTRGDGRKSQRQSQQKERGGAQAGRQASEVVTRRYSQERRDQRLLLPTQSGNARRRRLRSGEGRKNACVGGIAVMNDNHWRNERDEQNSSVARRKIGPADRRLMQEPSPTDRAKRADGRSTCFKIFIIALALALGRLRGGRRVGVAASRVGTKFASASPLLAPKSGLNILGACLGLLAGRAHWRRCGYFGFAALVGLGVYMMNESRTDLRGAPVDLSRGPGLIVASLAISLDSLGIGFSILYVGRSDADLSHRYRCRVDRVDDPWPHGGISAGDDMPNATPAVRCGLLLSLTGIAFATLKALHAG